MSLLERKSNFKIKEPVKIQDAVHFVYSNESENISDSQVQGQMDILN